MCGVLEEVYSIVLEAMSGNLKESTMAIIGKNNNQGDDMARFGSGLGLKRKGSSCVGGCVSISSEA